jgi:hypothetical protein
MLVELLVFKISGDGDYGALLFEQSKTRLSEVYEEMLAGKAEVVEDDDGWRVSLEKKILVTSQEQARQIMQLLADLTDDDWCGDYDRRKNTTWDALLLKDGSVVLGILDDF